MLLTDILKPTCVKVPLAAKAKEEVIVELIDVLKSNSLISNYDMVVNAVMERESVRSTGIGQGFAIPHCKCSAVDELVMAIGKLSEPIDFESIDGKPVSIVVMLVSPSEQTGRHIQALARISRLMTDKEFHDRVWQCENSEGLFQIIRRHEQKATS